MSLFKNYQQLKLSTIFFGTIFQHIIFLCTSFQHIFFFYRNLKTNIFFKNSLGPPPPRNQMVRPLHIGLRRADNIGLCLELQSYMFFVFI